jgi:hypothetical protein
MMPPPPPPAAKPSARVLAGINTVLADRALIERLRKLSDENEFFDSQGPAVRARRKMTRANFEYLVTTEYNGMSSLPH